MDFKEPIETEFGYAAPDPGGGGGRTQRGGGAAVGQRAPSRARRGCGEQLRGGLERHAALHGAGQQRARVAPPAGTTQARVDGPWERERACSERGVFRRYALHTQLQARGIDLSRVVTCPRTAAPERRYTLNPPHLQASTAREAHELMMAAVTQRDAGASFLTFEDVLQARGDLNITFLARLFTLQHGPTSRPHAGVVALKADVSAAAAELQALHARWARVMRTLQTCSGKLDALTMGVSDEAVAEAAEALAVSCPTLLQSGPY
jgi:hypothetical protein